MLGDSFAGLPFFSTQQFTAIISNHRQNQRPTLREISGKLRKIAGLGDAGAAALVRENTGAAVRTGGSFFLFSFVPFSLLSTLCL
ncbi:MAG TPA: hypothetical protein VGI88_13520 [Verrucomicrobiae bacterium]|jgi:hypothetical protein